MAPRTISLITSRSSLAQRAHFAIFVPDPSEPTTGTFIHVVGAPMIGFQLEFKRKHALENATPLYTTCPIGQIDSQHISDWQGPPTLDSLPRCAIEIAAAQVPAPRISQNFLAPVNDTTNRRCQEWTMDYVRRLVQLGYIDESAIEIVQSKRDPPSHGIGLVGVGAGQG